MFWRYEGCIFVEMTKGSGYRNEERWRDVLWWVALVVLMGGLLALATVVNAE